MMATLALKHRLWRALADLPAPLAWELIGRRDRNRSRARLERLLAREGARPLEQLPQRQRRSSDTVFILGSGSSVNRLSDEQWAEIRRADSIGFNFWPIHDFVPTLYVFEQPNDPVRTSALYQILERRADAYAATPVIAKTLNKLDLAAVPRSYRDRLYLSADYSLPVRDTSALPGMLRQMQRAGVLEPQEGLRAVPFRRASISYLVFLAWFLGYRQIVLCGIDLRHTGYFYEEERDRYEAAGLPVPHTGQAGAVHLTFDPGPDPVTVDEVLWAMDDVLLRPRGIGLAVAHPSSALHPRLPCYFDEAGRP